MKALWQAYVRQSNATDKIVGTMGVGTLKLLPFVVYVALVFLFIEEMIR